MKPKEPLQTSKPLSPDRQRRADSLTQAYRTYMTSGKKGLGQFLKKQREAAQARKQE